MKKFLELLLWLEEKRLLDPEVTYLRIELTSVPKGTLVNAEFRDQHNPADRGIPTHSLVKLI